MTRDHHRPCRAALLWPTVLAGGICLAVAGCSSVSDLAPGSVDPLPWLSTNPGSKVGSEAFKRKVEADKSFPTAEEAGV